MRVLLVLITLLSAWSIGLASPRPVLADSPSVTLLVTPGALELAPAESAQVVVTASIPTTTVQSITLSAHAGPGVTYTIHDPPRTQAPLQGDLAWTVSVTRTGAEQPAGKVYFRADYQAQAGDGKIVPGIALASLDIQDRTPDAVDKVIAARFETALDTIMDQQSRQVYVVVENISRVPVTVTNIVAWPIPNIDASVEDLGEGWHLAPQQSHPFSITLTAGDAVQPGKHLLVVQVDAQWTQGGQRTTGSVVLNKEFEAGVFGETVILAATGIPSLLLLPGFLFLTGLLLFVKWSWGKWLLELDFKKPPFWYWAVTISLVAVWLYPFATGPVLSRFLGRTTPSRNLLHGYGFNDILMLWLGAVLFGFVVWAVGSAIVLIVRGLKAAIKKRRERLEREREQREQRRLARLTPKEGDLPIVTLRKIANNQKWLDLEMVSYPQDDGQPQTVFVLPTGSPEEGKLWVAPPIGIRRRKTDVALEDKIDELLRDRERFRELIDELETLQSLDDPPIDVDWVRAGPHIREPTLVDEVQTKAHDGGRDPLADWKR